MLSEFALDVLSALTVRVCFLLYGEWQDRSNMLVKYTDVDYQVFTDAARYVAEGDSPYLRATYRYTPFVAWILIPNVLVHPLCGKLVFVTCDLISACFVHKIVSFRRVSNKKLRVARWIWLFNPLTITMSTRGSAESIVSALVLGTIYLLETDRVFWSGVLYGFAIHFKIYPIIYCLSFYFSLADTRTKRGFGLTRLLLPTYRRTKFTLATVASLLSVSAFCYVLYGDRFLEQAYLYHVTRKDTRHNFSVYFYYLYLSRNGNLFLLELLAFLPQVILLVAVAVKFYHRENIHVGLLVQTLIFVAFNKVCTSQYFVWYLTLLPLVVVRVKSFGKEHLGLVLMWLASQALWLLPAYLLEFQNLNTFVYIWLASLVLFGCNLYIIASVIKLAL